jgi:hypothetical protein
VRNAQSRASGRADVQAVLVQGADILTSPTYRA